MVAGRLATGAADSTARGIPALAAAARRLKMQYGDSGAGGLCAYMPHVTIKALL